MEKIRQGSNVNQPPKEIKKILLVGNSYSEDTMFFVPSILTNLGVTEFKISFLYIAGESLQGHWENYIDDSLYTFYQNTGSGWTSSSSSLKNAIDSEIWDLILFQQYSKDSGTYSTYQPYLSDLVSAVKQRVGNQLKIGFNLTWAYSTDWYADQIGKYNAISNAVQLADADVDFDYIIPSGTIIQNLRLTGLDYIGLEFTRDSVHIDNSMGRYAAACGFIKEIFPNVDLSNDTTVLTGNGLEVTNTNRSIIHAVVNAAITTKFTTTQISDGIVRIDFGDPVYNVPSPWITPAPTALSSTQLTDSSLSNVGLLKLLTAGVLEYNSVGYNNKAKGMPLNAWRDSWYTKGIMTFEVSLLNNEKLYDFEFFSSRAVATDVRNGHFTINSVKKTLVSTTPDGVGSTESVKFTNISPVAGKINFEFGIETSTYAYMNILKITEHN